MKAVPEILTGVYLESPSRYTPPLELEEAIGTPIPPALMGIKEKESIEVK